MNEYELKASCVYRCVYCVACSCIVLRHSSKKIKSANSLSRSINCVCMQLYACSFNYKLDYNWIILKCLYCFITWKVLEGWYSFEQRHSSRIPITIHLLHSARRHYLYRWVLPYRHYLYRWVLPFYGNIFLRNLISALWIL